MGLKQRLKLILYSLEFRLFRLRAMLVKQLHGGFDEKRFLMVKGDPLPLVKMPNPATDSSSYYFVSPHKCGSVLIAQIAKALAASNHVPYIDISTQVFKVGEGEHSSFENLGVVCAQPGYVHSTFRTKLYIDLIPQHAKTVVLIRDPRDAIVSKYYSDTKSHTIKGNAYNKTASDDFISMRKMQQTLDIDEAASTYVEFYQSQFDSIERLLKRSAPGSVKLYRYEDVIFNKREWILDMAAFMGWSISERQLRKLLSRVDILPGSENQNQHIRQVRPGNYKLKLKPQTQEMLTNAFADVLSRYSYTEAPSMQTANMRPWLCKTQLGELEINVEHPSRKTIEHYAAEFFAANGCATSRIYLPGQWTAFWHSTRKNPLYRLGIRLGMQRLSPQWRLSNFLESTLDSTKRYFTIVQRSTEISDLFPPNVLVFGAGGEGNIPIPLIKEIPEWLRQLRGTQTRDIKASFIGQWDGFNDPDDVRKQMVAMVRDLPGYVVGKQPYCEYIRTLARSEFTLSPYGFGRTSFRMYEALAMGSIPVYIYKDTPWLPYSNEIDWNRCAVLIERSTLSSLPAIIAQMSESEIKDRRDYIDSLYDTYFSFQGICQKIKYYLEHEHENH